MPAEHFDVLIVGAGLSGIGAAHHIQQRCPNKSYAILEGRGVIGGTWDLFRYPGLRSDSDMFTMGYSFRPWRGTRRMADGPSILAYIRDTARAAGIDRKIRFHHWVKRAAWSTKDAQWTVEAELRDGPPGEAPRTVRYTCKFLYLCSGYYRYSAGYEPTFPGQETFSGRMVHPQNWPADLDYTGKRVVVIGSGATAVTLVPTMAARAAHVTMLQRSPTYIMSMTGEDTIASWLRRYLPAPVAYGLARWKNILMVTLVYHFARRRPALMRDVFMKAIRDYLGPDYDVEKHFGPSYNPWDQRVCLVPDADLFRVIKEGRASVVTDHIEALTERGIRLKSGQELEADIIVSATGLVLELMGGMEVLLDGHPVDFSKTLNYRGMMYSDIPNFAVCIGYTNASWTLKADLISTYFCRLINFMDRKGFVQATPRSRDPDIPTEPWMDLTAGYVQRSLDKLPKQGVKPPWRLYQNYPLDILSLRLAPVDDEFMEFRGPTPQHSAS